MNCPYACDGLFAQVVDGHDVGVLRELGHDLGLAQDAGLGGVVEALGLEQGEGDVAVEDGVVGQVDLLLAALAQELLHRVAAVNK